MVTNNGIPYINGQLYSWGEVTVALGGVPVTGITAIDYEDKQDIKTNYGAGRYPVGYSKGRITCSGKLTLYQEELLALQRRSQTGRLQDLPPFDITVSYIKESGGSVVVDKLHNVLFSSNSRKLKEGDTGVTVEIDLILSHISWGK